VKQALLFVPRLMCAVTCVIVIIAAVPLIWLLGDSREPRRPT
jgi:hypothetical protein